MDSDKVTMLMDDAQLTTLALLLRNKEELIGTRVSFRSETDRGEYLACVRGSFEHAVSLLHDSAAMNAVHRDDATRGVVAADVVDYVKYGLNMSMQNVRNCSLRLDCISKIRAHYDSLVADLADLHPNNVANVRRLAKDTAMFKESMFQHCNNLRSGSARAASRLFSSGLQQEKIKFPELVSQHKNRLGFNAEFKDLKDAEKLEVYNSIINESGRAKFPKMEAATGALGTAVLVATAGLMVWDIFTAEHQLEAVVHNGLIALSEGGAFAVQVAVEAAVTTALFEADLAVFVVSLAGFVAGTVAGLVFIAISGKIMNAIFGSGGSMAPPVENLTFHKITPPDGMALANIIRG